jgi:hypothetical protein
MDSWPKTKNRPSYVGLFFLNRSCLPEAVGLGMPGAEGGAIRFFCVAGLGGLNFNFRSNAVIGLFVELTTVDYAFDPGNSVSFIYTHA